MRDSKKLVGHLYAMFTILVWGSCFVLTKNLLAWGSPLSRLSRCG